MMTSRVDKVTVLVPDNDDLQSGQCHCVGA